MPIPVRTPTEQRLRHAHRLAELEAARTKAEAGAVWSLADRDRDLGWLTDTMHWIVASRAEWLIALLPDSLIPKPRTEISR